MHSSTKEKIHDLFRDMWDYADDRLLSDRYLEVLDQVHVLAAEVITITRSQ